MKGKRIVQWDLTGEECDQLRERTYARMGNPALLEALQRALALQIQASESWWEAVILRLNIPRNETENLVADYKMGKVWIKGKVKELNDTSSGSSDNQCF